MKRLKYVIIAVFFMLAVGCGKGELPEGYTVLCSFEGNKYTLKFPDGRLSPCIWPSEKRAIHFAIYWEGVKDVPYVRASDKYEWDECK